VVGVGYTAARPEGWREETAPGASRLVLAREEEQARQEITVRVPLDDPGADSATIREHVIATGAASVTPSKPTTVDGEPATTFGYTKLLPSGLSVL
jgi:hypothetical protein